MRHFLRMAWLHTSYVEYSQVELSERTGLSQTSISQIESGAKNPSKKSVKKICEAFEIPEAILYAWEWRILMYLYPGKVCLRICILR